MEPQQLEAINMRQLTKRQQLYNDMIVRHRNDSVAVTGSEDLVNRKCLLTWKIYTTKDDIKHLYIVENSEVFKHIIISRISR